MIYAGLLLWGRRAGCPFRTDGRFLAVVKYDAELRRWNMEKFLEVGCTEGAEPRGLTGWAGWRDRGNGVLGLRSPERRRKSVYGWW